MTDMLPNSRADSNHYEMFMVFALVVRDNYDVPKTVEGVHDSVDTAEGIHNFTLDFILDFHQALGRCLRFCFGCENVHDFALTVGDVLDFTVTTKDVQDLALGSRRYF